MREFTSEYIQEKNALESRKPWAVLVELEVNVNTTAFFTTHPETHTWNGQMYAPVGMQTSTEEAAADGSLPTMSVDVSNVGGQAFKFAKDNDLSLNTCILRLVNVFVTTSGSDSRTKMQVSDAVFTSEVGRFNLEVPLNKDIFGPKRVYDRVTFPSIPFGFKNYYLVS